MLPRYKNTKVEEQIQRTSREQEEDEEIYTGGHAQFMVGSPRRSRSPETAKGPHFPLLHGLVTRMKKQQTILRPLMVEVERLPLTTSWKQRVSATTLHIALDPWLICYVVQSEN